MRLSYANCGLTGIGKELVRVELEEFQNRWDEAIARGASKTELVSVMTDTFRDAAQIMMDNGNEVIGGKGQWLEAYGMFADVGFDLYVVDMAEDDGKALVAANFKTAPKSSGNRRPSSGSKSKSQPRKANGQFSKKPRSSSKTKSTRRR